MRDCVLLSECTLRGAMIGSVIFSTAAGMHSRQLLVATLEQWFPLNCGHNADSQSHNNTLSQSML